ncbi:MAG: epoxide hydrolase [Phenylobacterium sp.]|jgi:pimeloyl-ACP methyl ester carboxylesterase|uniref:epoxide hydrolase family protein n=1 Tax=Phenylobacterium sp. TaxID=1871053 RepID=UPI0026102B17|nr:epoxide hydrolase family protein [Phenylobacterium sp.]MDB5427590.1 epoxide hydrolase [Phenylobacterium sp.]MDB5435159.1 epoxide hydrolase [Phenylobacterium sp.]MDB5499876.1 epoxide hydrolase [Phenylobacterium sp.]
MIVPFQIPWDPEGLADLNRRLTATRWNDAVVSDWSYGMERGFLQKLVGYWRDQYVWAERRAALNRLPHFRATIDGYGLHYLHYRGRGPDAVPLLLMNGWPSSFVEYQRLAVLLSQGEPSFDVVVPTHPGFGFSDRPTRPYQVEPADLYPKLMTALGHDRFMVSGTDVGSGVATRIALHYPDRVIAAHVSAVAEKPWAAGASPPTASERDYEARAEIWDRDEGGYGSIQSSKPQSLAFALADSPAGLASWIVEKFRNWSDCDGDVLSVFPPEVLIDNLMIYWTTNTIGSSVRYYYEASHLRPKLLAADFVRPPTAVAMWPKDIALAPRELAARLYNVQRYTVFPKGGHFPAWEQPVLYAEDLRQFERTVRLSLPR